jgi:hypothetical protein
VEATSGDDTKPKTLATGAWDDALRVPVEMPGKDVYLRYNRACGWFKETER